MALTLLENIPIQKYSAFQIGGVARFFTELQKIEDLEALSVIALEKNLPIFILGKGSNTIFGGGTIEAIVGLSSIMGRDIIDEDELTVTVQIGSGELWDDVVTWASGEAYSGIEALAAIPGTAGATPVQNVGAYGQEIKETFVELYAYDQKEKKYVTLKPEDCNFGYRSSIFNTTEKGRYLIGTITLKLSKTPPPMPHYPGVEAHLRAKGIEKPTASDISIAISEIRWAKLPRPEVKPNVGSFFKNAFVTQEKVEELKKQFPDIKTFPQPDGQVKVPSGWLIDKAGFKGKNFGTISVYEHNALVLVNNGSATFDDLMKAKAEIVDKVKDLFGIELVQEPLLVK